MSPTVEAVTQPVWLGEGPHWDEDEQALYFVSTFDKSLHKYVPATETHTSAKLDGLTNFIIPVENRPGHFAVGLDRRVVEVKWSGEDDSAEILGTMAEVDQENPKNRLNDAKADPRGRLFAGKEQAFFVSNRPGQFAVGLERRVVEVKWSGEDDSAKIVGTVAEVDQENPKNRLNDAKADPRGRLFAGTMGNEYETGKFELKKGSLYRIDADGTTHRVIADVDISNGLCWDVKEAAFYYADSFEYAIRRYDYDIETGNISNPRIVFRYSDHNLTGIADGMTIDTDGNLWVANFDGYQILKIDPRKSEILQKIPIPALQVTSCTFGGPNLDVLYVTTASMDRGAPQPPPRGATFAVTGLGVRGHPNVKVKIN